MIRLGLKLFIILIGFAFLSAVTYADQKAPPSEKQIEEFKKKISEIEKTVSAKRYNEDKLIKIQSQIDALNLDIQKYRKQLEPKLSNVKSQLQRLGPAPKKEDPAESDTVAALRKQLDTQLAEVDGLDKKASLLSGELGKLRAKIQDMRLNIFTDEIFRRYDSPLHFSTWKKVFQDSQTGFERLNQTLFSKKTGISWWVVVILIMVTCGLWFLLHKFSLNLINHFRKHQNYEGEDPAFFRKASSAILVSVVRMLPPLISFAALYITMENLGTFSKRQTDVLQVGMFCVVLFFAVTALARTLLAPHNGRWRLYPLSDEAAPRIYRLIKGIVFIQALNIFWTQLNDVINAPLSLTVTESFIASFLFASLLFALTLVRFQHEGEAKNNTSRLWPLWFKLPLAGFALAIIISSAFGYISLARFLASQIVITGTIVVLALLLTFAVSELTEDLLDINTPAGKWLHDLYHLELARRQQIVFLIGIILHLVVLAIVVPLLLIEWGFTWTDISSWLSAAFFGVKIGSINFSLSTVVIALCIFVGGLFITRFLQKWVERGSEKLVSFRNGVQNSVRTGVGYIGFAISLLIAISYVGVDFTNLAIVAGALSVGIGFGLQSIVNNFVSGLILLVERPVKVGDRVVIGNHEGYVRKISVRYTEVETFDRSSVIVPNSDLISNTITNWTHENSSGRVIIPVGVSYSSDAKKVYDILMEIGKNHPESLTFPPPIVAFEDFGASSLDFTLRIYIPDIQYTLKVKTELRMSILEAFREHNIEIPFPQQDLHIRGSEVLKVETNGTR